MKNVYKNQNCLLRKTKENLKKKYSEKIFQTQTNLFLKSIFIMPLNEVNKKNEEF